MPMKDNEAKFFHQLKAALEKSRELAGNCLA
jgi:hypothetical protein